jgi:hypothetical protein
MANCWSRVLVLTALLPALLASPGCRRADRAHTGVARVVVRPLVPESYIERLTVTVTGGSAEPSLAPIVGTLDRSGYQWVGRIGGIPAGAQRQFDAIAFDADGRALFAATARADIPADVATVVSMTLDNRDPGTVQNAFPVIDSIAWTPESPAPGGVVQLHATAHDPTPGDPLQYAWTSTCGQFDDATSPSPRWTAPAAEQTCTLTLTVKDSRGASIGVDLSVQVKSSGGADVIGTMNSWPIINSLGGALTVWNGVMDGDLVVRASDPDGDPLTYSWQSDCQGLHFDVAPPHGITAPHLTVPVSSAPCAVTVAVWDGLAPQPTIGTLVLSPEPIRLNCQNVVCPPGLACDPYDGSCRFGTCTSSCAGRVCGTDGCGGSCGSCPTNQSCAMSGQCVPTCAPDCAGKACGSDGCGGSCGSCGTNQLCDVTNQCVPGCLPSCTARVCGSDGCGGSCGTCTSGTCNDVTGQCVVSCTPACTGRACGSDGCGGSCGTCTTGTCDGATGQCVISCTPACTGRACGPDGCGGSCGTCTSGTCNGTSGQCVSGTTVVVPFAARDLFLAPPAGLAMDSGGNTYVTANLTLTSLTDFGGVMLQSTGGADLFVGKLDPSGAVTWAVAIGDDDGVSPTDQQGFGVAANAAGTVAVVGKVAGGVTFGASTIIAATDRPFIGALSAADGSRRWARAYDLGSNGILARIASSPTGASGRFAVCGQASKAATTLVPGAVYGGLQDAVVAVFDDAGNKLWAIQLGSAGNETCSAIAVDENGDVFAAGQFDGASLAFPGGPTLTGPNTTARKYLWVAKFNGATGATLRAVEYHGASGTVLPQAATVNAAGDLFVAGSFAGAGTNGPVFGTSQLSSAGGDDGFIAKLDRSTLAPVVSPVRIGGTSTDTIKGIAITSAGDVVATGSLNAAGGTSTGIAPLTPAGTSATDQLVLKLDGSTLATQFANVYGDTGPQSFESVVVNRFGTGAGVDAVAMGGTLSSTASYSVPVAFPAGDPRAGTAGAVTAGNGIDVVVVLGKLQ